MNTNDFPWTGFYQDVAKGLLDYKDNRGDLIDELSKITSQVGKLEDFLKERSNKKKTNKLLKDICPFTTLTMFNLPNVNSDDRKFIASEIANFLGVKSEVPNSIEDVLTLPNWRTWFFNDRDKRARGEIDKLWRVFVSAEKYVSDKSTSSEFCDAFDAAMTISGVRWNLTLGLHWAYPWDFPSLDNACKAFIREHFEELSETVEANYGPGFSGEEYLKYIEDLSTKLDNSDYNFKSFPAMSNIIQERRLQKNKTPKTPTKKDQTTNEKSYSVDTIKKDGCFLPRDDIERLREQLRTKKNLILQGSPGTGKTWLAKRLAFSLIGERDESKVRAVQFHPNLSYEDFVRGWRPSGDGKLSLVNGVFMEMIEQAKYSSSQYAIVIEEINRGNPAQIFGELLTLLEASKRNPDDALELCYPDPPKLEDRIKPDFLWIKSPVYIPDNLYIIGTMNIADRSLALIDFAFRRRFAFATLEPQLNPAWRNWIVNNGGVDPDLVDDIEHRINDLNQKIESELGPQFRIGHSYVTPADRIETGSTRNWFDQVAKTEIGPLLEEYWFDRPKTAHEALDALLKDW